MLIMHWQGMALPNPNHSIVFFIRLHQSRSCYIIRTISQIHIIIQGLVILSDGPCPDEGAGSQFPQIVRHKTDTCNAQ